MNADRPGFLVEIAARIDSFAEGGRVRPLVLPDDAPPAWEQLAAAVDRLSGVLNELRRVSTAIAAGQIDVEVPPRLHLLDPLKALQSSLKHLTWQTQEVAAGNLEHQVDFLGEFSTAFNSMVAALREKRHAEQEAMQAAKMAAIGQLAAGMAHEINTPIHYVSQNLECLATSMTEFFALRDAASRAVTTARQQGDLPVDLAELETLLDASYDDHPASDCLAVVTEALEGTQRIATIVQSMREFAQPGTAVKTMVDVNRVITNTQVITRNVWAPVATVDLQLDAALPPILAHANEVGQVILNLLVNAAEAIHAAGGIQPGVIRIATRRRDDDVVITVEDSGHGIPSELRERIFDLFFTTRPVGVGTGQGLAICRDIVIAKHGGRIDVGDSELGGASFTVRLPIIDEAAGGEVETADVADDLSFVIG